MFESESLKTDWRVSVQYIPTSRPNKSYLERRFIFEGHSRVLYYFSKYIKTRLSLPSYD